MKKKYRTRPSRRSRKIKKSKKSKRKSRKFGYSHNQGPRLYNVHMDDGILLANNAFNWMGNPEAVAENAGS